MTSNSFRFSKLRDDGLLDFGDGYRAKNMELGGHGPIFLRAAYLQDTGFSLDNPDRFIAGDLSLFGNKVSKLRDVVITTKGNSTGRIGIIRAEQQGAVYSPHLSYWRALDDRKIDQAFLYYWSLSEEFRTQLRALAHSTDMAPYLSLRDQGFLRITLPAPEVQRAIAGILGALDDKIELNRRMNETLEAMARALFKDCFVDFGPTRAKQEGLEPYLAPDLWSLFPERLDREGKPEGWKCGTLADVADLNSESWSAKCSPDHVEYVDLANTKWGTIEATERYLWSDAPSRARRVLRLGDTIVGTVRPGNGSYAFIGQDGLTGSTGFAVLRPKQPLYREVVYFAATAPENIERLSHRADGAAYPAVRPDVVGNTEFIKGVISVIQAFSYACAPLVDCMEANKQESRTLAQTRDLLLPKLMSGEIRIQDAEKAAEAVL